jgi:hypothetical protein
MAKIILTDASITVNSVACQLSNSVTLTYEKDSVEVTAFGDSGHKFTGGLQNITCEMQLFQDFAASQTEATIFPLVGVPTTLVIKPTSGATAADNPEYTLTDTMLVSHTPVAGAVGEVAMTTLSFHWRHIGEGSFLINN